ncbi:hypothetical protein A4X13_0g2116 [Tilletia indica]|uniref:Zn(2)-C6 fungal-type domain-containing protein n=1 Tax=Tilletia indica TaxID=43049 RepID=A0A8T8TAB1_9BASI|nr:hypothetical protein A4X13_0g2116 [Tilletia indica]
MDTSTDKLAAKRRKVNTCLPCKTRKIKCDKQRPHCGQCIRHSLPEDQCSWADEIPGSVDHVGSAAATAAAAAAAANTSLNADLSAADSIPNPSHWYSDRSQTFIPPAPPQLPPVSHPAPLDGDYGSATEREALMRRITQLEDVLAATRRGPGPPAPEHAQHQPAPDPSLPSRSLSLDHTRATGSHAHTSSSTTLSQTRMNTVPSSATGTAYSAAATVTSPSVTSGAASSTTAIGGAYSSATLASTQQSALASADLIAHRSSTDPPPTSLAFPFSHRIPTRNTILSAIHLLPAREETISYLILRFREIDRCVFGHGICWRFVYNQLEDFNQRMRAWRGKRKRVVGRSEEHEGKDDEALLKDLDLSFVALLFALLTTAGVFLPPSLLVAERVIKRIEDHESQLRIWQQTSRILLDLHNYALNPNFNSILVLILTRQYHFSRGEQGEGLSNHGQTVMLARMLALDRLGSAKDDELKWKAEAEAEIQGLARSKVETSEKSEEWPLPRWSDRANYTGTSATRTEEGGSAVHSPQNREIAIGRDSTNNGSVPGPSSDGSSGRPTPAGSAEPRPSVAGSVRSTGVVDGAMSAPAAVTASLLSTIRAENPSSAYSKGNKFLSMENFPGSERPMAKNSHLYREAGRRLWTHICTHDWFFSTFLHSYQIHPKHNSCAIPLNLDEDDLPDGVEEGDLPEERSHDLPSDCSGQRYVHVFADLARELTDKSKHGLIFDYDLVLEYDKKFRDVMESWPKYLRVDGKSEELDWVQKEEAVRPYIRHQRLMLLEGITHRILRLHRDYLIRGEHDPKYAYSTRSCIDAARTIIYCRQEMGTSDWIVQGFWVKRYHVFHAALALSLHLLEQASMDATPSEETEGIRQDIALALSFLACEPATYGKPNGASVNSRTCVSRMIEVLLKEESARREARRAADRAKQAEAEASRQREDGLRSRNAEPGESSENEVAARQRAMAVSEARQQLHNEMNVWMASQDMSSGRHASWQTQGQGQGQVQGQGQLFGYGGAQDPNGSGAYGRAQHDAYMGQAALVALGQAVAAAGPVNVPHQQQAFMGSFYGNGTPQQQQQHQNLQNQNQGGLSLSANGFDPATTAALSAGPSMPMQHQYQQQGPDLASGATFNDPLNRAISDLFSSGPMGAGDEWWSTLDKVLEGFITPQSSLEHTDRQTDRFPLLCFSELLSFATGDPLAAIRAHEQVFETTTVTNTPARISRCTKDTSQTIFASRSHP